MIIRYTHLFPIFKSKDIFGILIFLFEIVSLSLSEKCIKIKLSLYISLNKKDSFKACKKSFELKTWRIRFDLVLLFIFVLFTLHIFVKYQWETYFIWSVFYRIQMYVIPLARTYSSFGKKKPLNHIYYAWPVNRFKHSIYNLRFHVSPSILSSSPVLKAMKYYFILYIWDISYYTREYQQQHRLEITVMLLFHKWLTALTAFRYSLDTKPAIIISVTGIREEIPVFPHELVGIFASTISHLASTVRKWQKHLDLVDQVSVMK